ncbi:MAG: curved DNA-binding protein [Paraglaciecola sp.]|jgi:curved DNA-binding protein
MDFKDYYKILGVDENAELKEIKKAYRKMALKFHPDMNAAADAEEKFKEVAEAYEVLKDKNRRAEYDELRKYGGSPGPGYQPPPDWQSNSQGFAGGTDGADFSDFFNSIFASRGADSSGRRGSFTGGGQAGSFGVKGQDAEIEVPIFLEDTLKIESKTVEFMMPVVENGQAINRKKTLKVKIPLGVSDGERIRLKGQGGPGQSGGPNGDLYLHIRLVPHPLFDVQGHDLILSLPLTPWEAALGTKVTVPTLNGKITLNITANSQSGQKLRIKGKGLNSKTTVGDMFAVLKIMMPAESDDNANELWQKLADTAGFDPRTEWSN